MALELVETPNGSWQEKLWKYVEGPWFWGGVALISGFALANLKLVAVFGIGYVPISIGLIRSQFFSEWAKGGKILGNVGILILTAIILFGVWKIIPKSQPPLTIGDIKSALQPANSASSTPSSNVVPATSKEDSRVATKEDIQNLWRRVSQLQNESNPKPAPPGATITAPTQPSAPAQNAISVPIADQTEALKAITSTWTKSVNNWADSRLNEIPGSPVFPATPEDTKKVHDEIMREWQGFSPMAATLLSQYYRLNLIQGIINVCSGINIGQGDRGQLETYKRCAEDIQGAADRLK
jgi:hypothetical protein